MKLSGGQVERFLERPDPRARWPWCTAPTKGWCASGSVA